MSEYFAKTFYIDTSFDTFTGEGAPHHMESDIFDIADSGNFIEFIALSTHILRLWLNIH